MSLRIFAVLGIAAWLLIGTPAQAQDQPQGVQVKGADLTKLYEPPLMIDGYNQHARWWFSYALVRGGTIYTVYVDRSGSGDQLKGKYRVVGDTICATFPLAGFHSGEECFHIYQLADGSYQSWSIPDDKLWSTFRMRRPQ